MKTYKTREELRDRIIATFAAQPEVYHIHLFGREAEECSDPYSDVDMVVCTNDLARTKAGYLDLFESISPVKATFCLAGSLHSYSEMILLEDYSPYQKVDFTISDESNIAWPVGAPIQVVYSDAQKHRESCSRLEAVEIKRDVRYKLTDALFSVARFTKCLFRQDIDMYRRWQSISNLALVMLYEKHYGWEPETLKRGLGSGEIKRLYDDLDPEVEKIVNIIRPPEAQLDVALSYKTSIDLLVELSRRKAEYYEVALDESLIGYILDFMDVEMARYRDQKERDSRQEV